MGSLLLTSKSARSARQHKAWGAASEASKPQDRSAKKGVQPAERATDLECGGNPDLSGATRLWIGLMTQELSPAPAGSFRVMERDPGAHAPGFMLSCASRTVLTSKSVAAASSSGSKSASVPACCVA